MRVVLEGLIILKDETILPDLCPWTSPLVVWLHAPRARTSHAFELNVMWVTTMVTGVMDNLMPIKI